MMSTLDIVHYRLYNQWLYRSSSKNPQDVVSWLGAVQAQDYSGAKWALGQRMKNATDTAIEKAFNEGKILRTHVLRPTWHFVTPADIRWILMLTAPRVHAVSAYYYRQLQLDKTVFKRSNVAMEKALQGGKQLTRTEIATILKRTGIQADGPRLGYLMMQAELDGILCSGARRGKQFTYALLEERVPPAKSLNRDEALVELVRRYFLTRGPATLQDFAWWSGLTMSDAKNGIEMIRSYFVSEVINGQSYWFGDSNPLKKDKSTIAHLLPNYDEYFIGFKDRSAIGAVAKKVKIASNDPTFIANVIILDGQLVGGWKRTLNKDTVIIKLNLITKLTKAEASAVAAAAEKLGKYLELPVTLI